MKAYSGATGQTYDSWGDLVAAESNGFVLTAIISDSKRTWPYTVGPFPTEADANRERGRLRAKFKREQRSGRYPDQTYTFAVRPAWKPEMSRR